MRNIKTLAIVFCLSTLLAMSDGAWDHLGTRKVNFGLDHDRIAVTSAEGRFTKLKLQVSGNLSMHKMKVNFRNGTSQSLNIRHNFVQGRDSRVIDLKGDKRIIQSVDLWYDTKNRSKRRATVNLYGRH
jgi:hypothetical protein